MTNVQRKQMLIETIQVLEKALQEYPENMNIPKTKKRLDTLRNEVLELTAWTDMLGGKSCNSKQILQ